jgi:hypothetical protein
MVKVENNSRYLKPIIREYNGLLTDPNLDDNEERRGEERRGEEEH